MNCKNVDVNGTPATVLNDSSAEDQTPSLVLNLFSVSDLDHLQLWFPRSMCCFFGGFFGSRCGFCVPGSFISPGVGSMVKV